MDAVNDLKWLIFIIIALWIVWFFTGGPKSEYASGGLFLKPPAPLDTGETYGELPKIKNRQESSLPKNENTSIFQDKIFISNTNGALLSDPNLEYIELKAGNTNKNPIYISGWSIKNSNGDKLKIENASELPMVGKVNKESALFLNPGEKVVITTGRSPIGISFRINSCSGYLEQFQDFNPPIKLECPRPEYIAVNFLEDINSECRSFLYTMPLCSIYINELPNDLTPLCKNIIQNNINHNGCVEASKNRKDFYKQEWRVFLGSNTEFWSNGGDLIRLYDNSDNLVSSKSY